MEETQIFNEISNFSVQETQASRPTTPNSSSESSSKRHSITMERIKNQQSAALDRMTALQKRYHEHQQEKSGNNSDVSRRTSNASQFEDEDVSIFEFYLL